MLRLGGEQSGQYWHVYLDQDDLKRLGAIVEQLPARFRNSGPINVTVTPVSGAILDAKGSEVFLGPSMPSAARSVSISYRHPRGLVNCQLELSTTEAGAVLEVSGTDALIASGIQRMLDVELRARQGKVRWLVRWMVSPVTYLILGTVFAAWVYIASDLIARGGLALTPTFRDTVMYTALANYWWGAAPASIVGPFLCIRLLRRVLLPVGFTGKLTDPNSFARFWAQWLVVVVALPFVINLASNIVTLVRGLSR